MAHATRAGCTGSRLVLHVQPHRERRLWVVTVEGDAEHPLLTLASQAQAAAEARELAQASYVQDGRPARVVIHRPDGRERNAWTYGRCA